MLTVPSEALARNRPVNSLLETDLAIEYASRAGLLRIIRNASRRGENGLWKSLVETQHLPLAPEITQDYTVSLEDTIKQRIADSLFDDVERKLRTEEPVRRKFPCAVSLAFSFSFSFYLPSFLLCIKSRVRQYVYSCSVHLRTGGWA